MHSNSHSSAADNADVTKSDHQCVIDDLGDKACAPLGMSEADVLVALQHRLFEVPGVVPGARALSLFGEHAAGWMALGAIGAWRDPRRRHEWVALGTAALTSHAASVVIKRIVRRRRPHDERIRVGVSTPSKLSFPSSHSTSTTASLVCTAKILGNPVPLVGVPLMMASRMVLGVHYPTDVATGALVGWLGAAIVQKVEKETR